MIPAVSRIGANNWVSAQVVRRVQSTGRNVPGWRHRENTGAVSQRRDACRGDERLAVSKDTSKSAKARKKRDGGLWWEAGE